MYDFKVVKRDGLVVNFDSDKIKNAIHNAASAQNIFLTDKKLDELTEDASIRVSLYATANKEKEVSIEKIQDVVETVLIAHDLPSLAKEYILYRNKRTEQRELNSELIKTLENLTFTDSSDFNLKRENGNIDGNTAMATMLRYGSESSKKFYKLKLIDPRFARAHDSGLIHIHDLDFYALTETCCQIDIAKLFKDGFSTGHGYLREPSNILSASALTCITIQANQNEQHGGQSIPALDFALAKYVALTYIKRAKEMADMMFTSGDSLGKTHEGKEIERILKNQYITRKTIIDNRTYNIKQLQTNLPSIKNYIPLIEGCAWKSTIKDTYQAMEALIHNLNTLHSRAGSQVPFSSVNYGTDTSAEGRLIIKCLLEATWQGLGNGENPIFPIQIFKVKEGINYNVADPNHDLFQLACKVSAKRLFPNFSFLDAPFNAKYYKEGHPETEATYMGCRTRVLGNNFDKSREIAFSRGNLSFTSMNLPRLAIIAKQNNEADPLSEFFSMLDSTTELVFDQLTERFKYQCMRKAKNYPFLMGQGIWLDSEKLNPEDSVEEVLKHGSLTVGFIGLAECLTMLIGKHHGESEEAQELGLKIISRIRELADKKSQDTGLNYAVIATPAEGLSERFVKIDKTKFGEIAGVTDKDYYTNSFHIPVNYPIDIESKIKLEAPYHDLTNGGHITYIEYDGDPLKNLDAFESIIRMMHDYGIGYGAINHPVDYCSVCGYTGIIDDECPICGNDGKKTISIEKLKELKKTHPFIRIPKEYYSYCELLENYEKENEEDESI